MTLSVLEGQLSVATFFKSDVSHTAAKILTDKCDAIAASC